MAYWSIRRIQKLDMAYPIPTQEFWNILFLEPTPSHLKRRIELLNMPLLDAVRITAAQVYVNTALMKMRIEQYIQMIDYALWEVIENGATLPKTTTVEGVMKEMPITTAEEKAQRRLEDAKKLLGAVEKRFGGNASTKKTQRNLLKQQYENFTAPSSEMLDQTFDRLQKLVSQLELLDEKLSQEDMNKADLDTMSMDDLYNNLKVYEPDVKGMSSSSSSTQNMAFNTSSTDSQMHNNIMAAGSKDRPPMLGPGRYSQWRSRFLWYIDTKPNGEGLRKSILSGPRPSTLLVQAVAARKTQRQRNPNRPIVTPQSESVSDEDSDPEQARGDKICKEFGTHCKSISKGSNKTLPTTTFELLLNSGKRRRYHTKCKNRDYYALICKGFGQYAKKCRKQSVLKTTPDPYERELMYKKWKHITRFMAKIQDGSTEDISSTDIKPLEQLNDTLGLLALKDIEIKEGLKTKVERISHQKKKTRNKMTKPGTEWKSCEGQSQSKAKDQISQSQSQLNKSTVKTKAVIEEYYWLQSQPI
ncbi:hypothetical protein Tco_1009278 [Tanacetum coccineum]